MFNSSVSSVHLSYSLPNPANNFYAAFKLFSILVASASKIFSFVYFSSKFAFNSVISAFNFISIYSVYASSSYVSIYCFVIYSTFSFKGVTSTFTSYNFNANSNHLNNALQADDTFSKAS